MTTLTEGDLQITLPSGAVGRKFDKDHGLSHCMKAVDFIVELEDRIYFIEFKDPEDPHAKKEKREEFYEKFRSGKLYNELKQKYRDSFLYEWGSGRVTKPIYYLVLIGLSSLTEAELMAKTDALRRQLPILGPRGTPWKNPFVAGCGVMSIETWNRKLPQFPVCRLSGTNGWPCKKTSNTG